MIYPSLTKAKEIVSSGEYKRLPLKLELFSDTITPIIALRRLKQVSSHTFMLESADASKKWGRYTFLGFDPCMEVTCTNGQLEIKSETIIKDEVKHPGKVLRQIINENNAPILEEMPPFCGGLVGYFSYDYIKYSEPTLKLDANDEENFKDVDLMIFDKVVAFDNFKQKVILIVNIKTDDLEENYHKGEMALERMAQILLTGELGKNPQLKIKSEFKALFDEDEYCEMVRKGKNYIYEGDIFQVVLSNRLEAKIERSLLDTYRILRTTNPSPYMFYFSSDDVEIAGASPETLVKMENGVLHTFPLAGTRPRGKTEKEDMELERELLNDEKELAEHNMLVDLGRNDIGRISKVGTVEVENI